MEFSIFGSLVDAMLILKWPLNLLTSIFVQFFGASSGILIDFEASIFSYLMLLHSN